jgi:ADP-dependent NAD(P)H-hydrate dehydratase / NAD(P)H-hydrate epimerase
MSTIQTIREHDVQSLWIPQANSHKGQNGRLLLIGGSHFFHAASLWALTAASRLVDLVHYASVPENNQIVQEAKTEFRNGMVVPRQDIERYILEDDVILIGPGMVRKEQTEASLQIVSSSFAEIIQMTDEGLQTEMLTNYLLKTYPYKQWVIDAGALQMVDVRYIPHHAILTPHASEFEQLLTRLTSAGLVTRTMTTIEENLLLAAQTLKAVILLKGTSDVIGDGTTGQLFRVEGGNAGMTKGGTGDILAGLVAGLAAKNDAVTAAYAGSFFNKRAGDELFQKVGYVYNASDVAAQLPYTMKQYMKYI